MKEYDVIIIGAGAAGLMCAIEAGKRGRSVLVMEHAEKIGKKILISGGGRCNFTNVYASHENFICSNPHFHKSALARYSARDFISLVESHRISYHEKKLGQLFCTGSAKDIVGMLESECAKYDVKILTECNATYIIKTDKFILNTSKGTFHSQSLVMASGGPSIPKMGATDFGYKIAKQFGLKLVQFEPALVPFTMDEVHTKEYSTLSGVSLDAEVSCNGAAFKENVLLTHRGFSGPAILQASSYWSHGDPVNINVIPVIDIIYELNQDITSNAAVSTFLAKFFPKRFIDIRYKGTPFTKPVSKLSESDMLKIKDALENWVIYPKGTEGYAKAEVTKGGVSTDELSSKTMESKKVPGLYFIGEVVDVTGWLGGYNFQWAWSSGFAAGQYA